MEQQFLRSGLAYFFSLIAERGTRESKRGISSVGALVKVRRFSEARLSVCYRKNAARGLLSGAWKISKRSKVSRPWPTNKNIRSFVEHHRHSASDLRSGLGAEQARSPKGPPRSEGAARPCMDNGLRHGPRPPRSPFLDLRRRDGRVRAYSDGNQARLNASA